MRIPCFLFLILSTFLLSRHVFAQENEIPRARLAEIPKIGQIVYQARTLSDDEAREIANLSLGDAQDESKIKTALEKLTNYFKYRGYQKAVGTFNVENVPGREARLVLGVTLGPKTVVGRLLFSGLDLEDLRYLDSSIYWNFVGEALTEEKLKQMNIELRRRLNDRGLFLVSVPNPQIIYNKNDTEVRVSYSLTKKPKYFVSVQGNLFYDESYLKEEVLKLPEYAAADDSFVEDLLTKLQKFYLTRGYLHQSVESELVKNNDGANLVFRVSEGKKVSVQKIKITGNISRPERYYVTAFNSLASPSVQEGLFIRSDIEQATKNLMVQLQNEGYVSAKLKKLDLSTDQRFGERGSVLIQIDEGPQTRLAGINFENNLSFTTEELLRVMNLKDSKLLNLNEIESALNRVRIFYAERGHLEMKITNLDSPDLVVYNDDYTTAQIKIILHEGPQVYVGSIEIEGELKTHHRVILSELEFKPGDMLTPQKLEESISRLQKTGLFATTEIKMRENNVSLSARSIIVSLSERKPGILTTGVGLTNENEFTVHGYAGAAYRNIGGWGRGISIRADGNYNPTNLKFLESKVVVGFLEPYLFDSRVRFRVNYTASRLVTDYTIRQKTITNQAVWSLEQDFSSHVTAIWQIYNIANYVDEGITLEDEFKYNYTRNDLVIASTGPTIDLDYRDNVLNPYTGHLSRFNLDYATSLLGSHNIDDFVRVTAQSTVYWNVWQDLVWANSLRGGYLHPLNRNADGVRFDKKGFILGGRTTVRGFESNEFFPSAETLGANYSTREDSSFELFKSELRFPLFNKTELAAGIFYDGGRVRINELNQGTTFVSEWRDSIGIGIRYNLPIGPLNLEYARKLNRKSSESEGAFHLSVGVF